jgi:hypothetical protein
MIHITPSLLEAFSPYRSVCSLHDVVIKNVPAVNNAYFELKKLGLPVSKKVIVNILDITKRFLYYGSDRREYHIFSYDFLEIGTEDLNFKNNIATLSTTFNNLHIHFYNGKNHVGRMHGLKVPQWHEVWDDA